MAERKRTAAEALAAAQQPAEPLGLHREAMAFACSSLDPRGDPGAEAAALRAAVHDAPGRRADPPPAALVRAARDDRRFRRHTNVTVRRAPLRHHLATSPPKQERPFMHRETLFQCTYSSSRARRSVLIPAWDAETAESLFREVLAEDAQSEAGIIEVQAHGRMQRRSQFSPCHA